MTGRKLGLTSMVWSRGKKTFNHNRMKKQEFKKMRRGLGTSRTTSNVPTSKHRSARGKQQQEIENLFENIMKENFPNLAKKIDF